MSQTAEELSKLTQQGFFVMGIHKLDLERMFSRSSFIPEELFPFMHDPFRIGEPELFPYRPDPFRPDPFRIGEPETFPYGHDPFKIGEPDFWRPTIYGEPEPCITKIGINVPDMR